MSAEFWAILGVGVSLALLLYQFTNGLRGDVVDLRECMSKLEGLFEGYVRGDSRASTPPA